MIQKRKDIDFDLVNSPTLYKIIYLQKMTFEQARLDKDYEIMRAALQNIIDNIINKASKENKQKEIEKINIALNWFDTLQFNKKYIKKMPTGERIHRFPSNISLNIDKCMSFVYKELNKLIEDLNIV